MWTEITRAKYDRSHLRYASDLDDLEWTLIAPLLPGARHTGRPRETDLREVVNALFYMLCSGCQWRLLPREFPPMSTVQDYFYAWRDQGIWQSINDRLVALDRSRTRGPRPSAGIVDSQSVSSTESGGPSGLDPAKKVKGRKRHIVTDTEGNLLQIYVHSANVQDVHGAVPLLQKTGRRFHKLRHIFADRVYRGPQLQERLSAFGNWNIEIVERPPGSKGFQLLPRRWVVERTFAWIGRRRRLAKDFETQPSTAETWIYMASALLLTRRLARPS